LCVSLPLPPPPPPGAHTTASDALLGTLPVLTLPGPCLASRVAAGLNAALRLPLLTAESRRAYVEVAVALRQPRAAPLLRDIRSHIYNELGESLFNSTRFSARLETAYKAAYDLLPTYRHIFFPSNYL
jgi:predicted O-linked N-acetylglucosamine transferase (SPINDLY family)